MFCFLVDVRYELRESLLYSENRVLIAPRHARHTTVHPFLSSSPRLRWCRTAPATGILLFFDIILCQISESLFGDRSVQQVYDLLLDIRHDEWDRQIILGQIDTISPHHNQLITFVRHSNDLSEHDLDNASRFACS